MLELVYEPYTETYTFYEDGKPTGRGIMTDFVTPKETGVSVPGLIVLKGGEHIFESPCFFNMVEKKYVIRDLNFIVNHFKISITKDRFYEVADILYNKLLRLSNLSKDDNASLYWLINKLAQEQKQEKSNIFKNLFSSIKKFF